MNSHPLFPRRGFLKSVSALGTAGLASFVHAEEGAVAVAAIAAKSKRLPHEVE